MLLKLATPEDAPTIKQILEILETAKDLPKQQRYARYIAEGSSMEPTIADKERVWVDKNYYQTTPVSRNDLIIFKGQNGNMYMRRVAGLPGETIRIDQEKLFVNGKRDSSMFFPGNTRSQADVKLNDKQVFVIGDNYNNSSDSRSPDMGPIALSQIVGKINYVEHITGKNKEKPAAQTQPQPSAASGKTYKSPPEMAIDTAKKYQAKVHTNKGDFTIELFAETAPKTVNNFVFLSRERFYDDVIFHRIIKSFIIQGGDPTGTGRGGPGYKFEDELQTSYSYEPGIVAMANAGPNTNGSQFFICTGEDCRGLNQIPNYTIFGKVTEGMDTVLAIADVPVVKQYGGSETSKPTEPVFIQSIDIVESQ
ncbi:signal peptidase I [Paenibacillus hamazuiensis]|uniref:signal peptidase I n=1 Tax=Paenibacillus hamazuiensis TaxID=2936508 RepID=UPI003B846A2A